MDLNKDYWENRYKKDETGWDVGGVSAPLKAYFDQLEDKNIRILVPGGGNGYEAAYLFETGFSSTYLLDIAQQPLDNFQMNNPQFPANQLLNEDFFNHKGQYDLIVEQTFFCALDRNLRSEYASKMSELLRTGGKLVGLLFNHEMDREGPPFGGTKEEYFEYFRPYFEFTVFENCYNSIKPRSGRELFMILKKK